MAFEETNGGGGIPATMLVGPTGYGGVNNGGFGGFGGDWGWIILLLLFAGGGWGMGGFGGGFGNMMLGYDFPWVLNGQQNVNNNVSSGFRDAQINDGINAIQSAVTSGFGDVQTALCGGFAGVNSNISNAAAQAEISANGRAMANMQQLFGVQTSLQQCCCDNKAGIESLRYTIATENCADRTTSTQNTQAILTALQSGVQSIKDQLCQDKISAKDDIIAQLRQEVLFSRGQQSQDVQTAAIQAGQRALANEVEQYVLPTPRPAYIVQNPNCCATPCGCGGGFAN